MLKLQNNGFLDDLVLTCWRVVWMCILKEVRSTIKKKVHKVKKNYPSELRNENCNIGIISLYYFPMLYIQSLDTPIYRIEDLTRVKEKAMNLKSLK